MTMNTVFSFEPGDRIRLTSMVPVPGIVVDDADTPPGQVAVVLRDDVCSGVWYVRPEWLELVTKAEKD
jgi:hypothetical protein